MKNNKATAEQALSILTFSSQDDLQSYVSGKYYEK